MSLWLISFISFAQKIDSLNVKPDTIVHSIPDSLKIKKHSPKLAALMSTAIPGLGQVYNKKYWKVPIIYAAFTADYLAYASNQKGYLKFKQAFIYRTDNDSNTVDEYENIYDANTLKSERDDFRKYRDLNFIIAAGIYVLNIIDANVDAHLFYFNVSDDLSLNIQPMYINTLQPYMGLTMQINIHTNTSLKNKSHL